MVGGLSGCESGCLMSLTISDSLVSDEKMEKTTVALTSLIEEAEQRHQGAYGDLSMLIRSVL